MRYLSTLLLVFMGYAHAAESLIFSSTANKSTLLELYTSEGCSSCPPADRWLSQLTKDARLWQEIVPIAWHVDYWDYIGWQDPFATPQNSARQARYKHEKRLKTVYTPGFVVDGKEWRGWFRKSALPTNKATAGVLRAELEGNRLNLSYAGAKSKYVFNFTLLGFGLKSEVTRGENQGRQLRHDFVVLQHHQQLSVTNQAEFEMPPFTFQAASYGLAVWVNTPNSLAPLQATGGYLAAR